MRLRVYGIPKIMLFLYGLLPGFAAFFFHYENFLYRPVNAISFGVGSVALALFFSFFFLGGFFRLRYLISILLFGQIFFELIAAVLDRNFSRLGLGILLFFFSIACTVELQKRIASASLNPRSKWFEGDPLTHPKVEIRVKLDTDWCEARIRAIDERGFFVFVPKSVPFRPQQLVSFELGFKGASVVGEAKLTSSFVGEKLGFGLQFSPKDLYHFSQYTALVQRLRGEGLFT